MKATLVRIARDVRREVTYNETRRSAGLCSDASELILEYGRDLPLVMVGGEVGMHGHYWVETEDGVWTIDVTCDQFNDRRPKTQRLPRVYVGVRPSWYTVCAVEDVTPACQLDYTTLNARFAVAI